VDVNELDHAIIVQFSDVAVSKHALRAALAIITFISTFTAAVDNSTICTNVPVFCVEFCPFLVLLCNG